MIIQDNFINGKMYGGAKYFGETHEFFYPLSVLTDNNFRYKKIKEELSNKCPICKGDLSFVFDDYGNNWSINKFSNVSIRTYCDHKERDVAIDSLTSFYYKGHNHDYFNILDPFFRSKEIICDNCKNNPSADIIFYPRHTKVYYYCNHSGIQSFSFHRSLIDEVYDEY